MAVKVDGVSLPPGFQGRPELVYTQTLDKDGNAVSNATRGHYRLLDNASATGSPIGPIDGGEYIWRAEGNFNGATATLEFRSLDGSSWFPVTQPDGTTPIAMTSVGSAPVAIGQGSIVRVSLTGGSPSGMHSVLGGI